MKRILLLILLLVPAGILLAQEEYQWAPPLLEYQTIFFKKETSVSMKFAQPGTRIHYTTQQRKPTASDPVYSKPVAINKRYTKLSAAVFGGSYRASDAVSVEFIKDGLPFKANLLTPTNPKYPGTGPNTLYDNLGGITGISYPGWMGFNNDVVRVQLDLEKKTTVSELLIHTLQAEGSWVFLPSAITVYYIDAASGAKKVFGRLEYKAQQETSGAQCVSQRVRPAQKISTNQLIIEMSVVNSIPDWHPGKGQQGWLFIDEIKVY